MNASDGIEQSDQGRDAPGAVSDSLAYDDLVLADMIQQPPMDGGMVVVGPAEEAVVEESAPDEKISFNVPGGDVDVAASPNPDESENFRTLWNEIQGKFVEEPRAAVQHADTLVSELIEKITQQFSSEQSSLERQWKEGKDVSTEDLRKALLGYRSFFNRLVN
jgi:hypothetical protein